MALFPWLLISGFLRSQQAPSIAPPSTISAGAGSASGSCSAQAQWLSGSVGSASLVCSPQAVGKSSQWAVGSVAADTSGTAAIAGGTKSFFYSFDTSGAAAIAQSVQSAAGFARGGEYLGPVVTKGDGSIACATSEAAGSAYKLGAPGYTTGSLTGTAFGWDASQPSGRAPAVCIPRATGQSVASGSGASAGSVAATAMSQTVSSGPSQLSWVQSTSGGVSGYLVRWGTSTGNYTSSLDVGNVTSVPLSTMAATGPDGLTQGTLYYIVIEAYGAAGYSVDSSPELQLLY